MKYNVLLGSFFILLFECLITACSDKASQQPDIYPIDPVAKKYQLRDVLDISSVDDIIANAEPSELQVLPNIYVFWIDTLRSDHVTPELAPNLVAFSNDADVYHFKNAYANSVTTYFSATAMFYSVLGHNRPYMISEGYSRGALNLGLLREAGYGINLYGRPNNYYCVKPGHSAFTEQYFQNLFLYSFNTYQFINQCNTYQKSDHSKSYARYDHLTISKFKKEVKNLLFSRRDGNLFLIHLDGVHAPYSWPEEIFVPGSPYVMKDPYMLKVKGEQDYPDPQEQVKIKNAYANAVAGADYQFGRFIKRLKSINAYDDAIIVVVSDHGERLFNSDYLPADINRPGHSGVGYNDLVKNVLIMRLPGLSGPMRKTLEDLVVDNNKSVGLKDVFPTLFDVVKIKHTKNAEKYIVGKSFFKSGRPFCQASYAPDWDRPPHWTFIQPDLKAYVKMERETPKSKVVAFKALYFFDSKDRLLSPMDMKNKFGVDVNDRNNTDKFIEKYFSDCLMDIVKP